MPFVGKEHIWVPDTPAIVGTGAHLNAKRTPNDPAAGTDFGYVLTGPDDDYIYVGGEGGGAPTPAYPVAALDDVLGVHRMSIPSNNAHSGGSSYLGVFRQDRVASAVAAGTNHGWWHNTTGSAKSVRFQHTFAFGAYSASVWVVVSATPPDQLDVAPAASAAAVDGVTQLTVPSGGAASGTVSVPDGSYLYIVAITQDYSWQGSSSEMLSLHLSDGTFLDYVIYFPSYWGSGNVVETWKSPVFVMGGTTDVPSGRWYGNWAAIYVPPDHYVYAVQLDVNISWAGGSNQSLYLHDGATGIVATFAAWPTQFGGPGNPTVDTWQSPFFLADGTDTPPLASKWNLAALGVFRQDVPSGYYQNGPTGRTMYIANDFPYGGYAMAAALVVDATAPADLY